MYKTADLIDQKLRQRICANVVYNYNFDDVYVVNQNNELFKKSDPSKQRWRHYINGGKVVVLNPNYSCSYNFDFGRNYSMDALTFISFNDNSGMDFNDFFNKIMTGSNEKFIWTNNLEVNNIKNKLLSIKQVQIIDTLVDNALLKQLLTKFRKLESIEFISCVIKDECSFDYSYKGKISFERCLIENFSSFRNSSNNLIFRRSKVLNYSCCTCLNQDIDFFHTEVDFYQLFLKTNFPQLEDLCIKTPTKYDEYGNNFQTNFKNSFFYLPYSSPKLTNLRIEGKVDNLDFLTRLTFLNRVSIVSTSGDMLIEYLDINDKNKLEDLLKRNSTEIEIKKILSGDDVNNIEYYATESEMKRVLRLNNIYRLLAYTDEEKEVLIDKKLDESSYINFLLNDSSIKLDGYYKNYYDRLIFNQIDKRENLICGLKLCYQHNALFYESIHTNIVKAEKVLFYIDGRPIILRKSSKPISTVEEALKFIENKNYKTSKEDLTLEYLEQLKRVVSTLEANGKITDINMNDFLFYISEEGNISLSLIYKDLLNRLDSGHEIFYKLHIDDERWKYKFHLKSMLEKCKKSFNEMINSRFTEFSKEELLVIGKQCLGDEAFFPYLKIEELHLEEDKILESINNKCNGNYLKMLEVVNTLNTIESRIFKKEYTIKKEELEKIKTLTLKEK